MTDSTRSLEQRCVTDILSDHVSTFVERGGSQSATGVVSLVHSSGSPAMVVTSISVPVTTRAFASRTATSSSPVIVAHSLDIRTVNTETVTVDPLGVRPSDMHDELRKQAHEAAVTVWVGKAGIEPTVSELTDQLQDRTLVKVKFLRAARGGTSTEALAEELAGKADAELIETRGHTAVFH